MKNNSGKSLLVLCALILVALGAFGVIRGLTSTEHNMHSAEAMDDSTDHSMMAQPKVYSLSEVSVDCSEGEKCQAGDAPQQDAPTSEHGEGHLQGKRPKLSIEYHPLP